jgi:hypothetical protein
MYNHADMDVQFSATEVFSLLRRHCSVSNGAGVQRERYIHSSFSQNSQLSGKQAHCYKPNMNREFLAAYLIFVF